MKQHTEAEIRDMTEVVRNGLVWKYGGDPRGMTIDEMVSFILGKEAALKAAEDAKEKDLEIARANAASTRRNGIPALRWAALINLIAGLVVIYTSGDINWLWLTGWVVVPMIVFNLIYTHRQLSERGELSRKTYIRAVSGEIIASLFLLLVWWFGMPTIFLAAAGVVFLVEAIADL